MKLVKLEDKKQLATLKFYKQTNILIIESGDDEIHQLFHTMIKSLKWGREQFDSKMSVETKELVTTINHISESEWVVMKNNLMTHLNFVVMD